MNKGVPTFSANSAITIPTAIDMLRKHVLPIRDWWYESDWPVANPVKLTKLFVELDDMDWEVLYYSRLPYLLRQREVYMPSVYRDALLTFKERNTTPIVELIDTFGGLSSLSELVPGTCLNDLKARARYLKTNCFCEDGVWKEITKHGVQKMSKARLRKVGISKKNVLRALAAAVLESQYGIKLPLETLKSAFAADNDDLWALSLQSIWNEKARRALEDKVELDPILRSRFRVNDRTTVSCSVHCGLAIDDMFMRTYTAFYKAGILMDFEGDWDLKPLSFALDWLSRGTKNFARTLDATTVRNFLRIHRTIMTIKSQSDLSIVLDGHTFSVDVIFYLRDIVQGGYGHLGLRIQDFAPGFQAQFLPEASSLIYLLKE
jgi:hypothetical protein